MDTVTETSTLLVHRIRCGDASAETELVESFTDRVFAMAVVRTRDRDASRDLTQDVLWAVVQALREGKLREPEKLAAFVCGTARNLINNYLRTRPRSTDEVPGAAEPATGDPGLIHDSDERLCLVRRAMANLEPDDCRILLLTLVEGLKPGEIAARLHFTAEVVRQRKSRAIKKVIGILDERSRK